MNSAWLSYVPQHVARDLVRRPAQSQLGRERRFQVVALFADVSGFTAMSEALARSGRTGTEELTDVLNSYFGPMIDLIQSYGGIIGKFGGDAMTVLFPTARSRRGATARRAIQCALDMQAAMGRYAAIETSAGTFSLAMKAGLALGPVLCTIVGDPQIQLEYIIAGGVLDRCADAEHHAEPGEVVIHDGLLSYAGAVEVAWRHDDVCRVAGLKRRAWPAPLAPTLTLPSTAIETIARFLHPAIAQLLEAGQAGFINEHRKVTVLFMNFGELDYDHDPRAAATLQGYLSAVMRIVQRYDGYLSRVDMGDKGSKSIMLFGAPIAHEDDEERALQCALELRALDAQPSGLRAPARIGVNTGFVYCGQVGSPVRQEYTVMGDAVNLAARLMQAARPGQILVGDATYRPVGDGFEWETLAPMQVKGKSDRVSVWALRAAVGRAVLHLHEPAYALPMVGRERELRRAREAIDRAAQGRGQIIGITGEAGMGKSRLNAEIVQLALESGFAVYAGSGQSYGANISYLAWHTIWRDFFQVSPSGPPDAQARVLEQQLAEIDPRLAQRTPLLGVALNIPIPDNELTRSLDAQLRTELLRSLLLDCLRVRVRPAPDDAGTLRPLVLVLEDCHWLDPLSLELLEFVGRNIADLPILLIALYRPPEQARGPLHWATRFGHFSETCLTELESAQAEQLMRLKLARLTGVAGDAPAVLVERVAERAQGNPFYIEEMINYIHDRGVNLRDERALQALDLPDSLRSLIISRIDRLAEDEQITLKVASIVGRQFRASWLWGSYPQLGTPSEVRRHLDRLSRLDLTPLDRPEPELEYLFRHITTQEVAYESLTFALRAMLHERVGEFIERSYAAALPQYLDVLAYHYGSSRNTDKQRLYFRQAGEAAQAAYANTAALDYYQRLLPLLPESEQSQVRRKAGEVLQLIGKWPEAEEMYRHALARAEAAGDHLEQAHCQTELGNLLSFTQSYEEALRWLEGARAEFEQLNDQAGLIRVLEYLSLIYVQQSDYATALERAERQLQLAMACGDKIGISTAVGNIGLVYWNQADYTRASVYLQQALDSATTAGYQRAMIIAGSNLAGMFAEQGDYARALISLRQALDVATDIGYQHAAGVIIGNAGEIYRQQGDYNRALACYQYGLQVVTELSDWTIIYISMLNIAITYAARGSYQEAEPLFAKTIALGRALNIPYFLCEGLYHIADLYTHQGRYAEALPVNREALDIAGQIGRKEIQFQAQILAMRLRVALGQAEPPTAIGELEELHVEWPGDAEQAAIDYTIWLLDSGREISRRAAADRYRALYAKTPNIEYRWRYTQLSGAPLPDPPPLPALPTIDMRGAGSLDELLARAERLIETAPWEQQGE